MNNEIIKGFNVIHFNKNQKDILRDLPVDEKLKVLEKFYLNFMVEDPINGTKNDDIILDILANRKK
jgi:hypothetical protein